MFYGAGDFCVQGPPLFDRLFTCLWNNLVFQGSRLAYFESQFCRMTFFFKLTYSRLSRNSSFPFITILSIVLSGYLK